MNYLKIYIFLGFSDKEILKIYIYRSHIRFKKETKEKQKDYTQEESNPGRFDFNVVKSIALTTRPNRRMVKFRASYLIHR